MARSTGAIAAVRKPWKGARANSPIEAQFELGLKALKFPPWERDLVFLEGRKFELDFAWPQWMCGVEIDGHVHRISERYESDIEKHWLAWKAGWTILRVGGTQVRSGIAFTWAQDFLTRCRTTITRRMDAE